jgi:hypothetical protein
MIIGELTPPTRWATSGAKQRVMYSTQFWKRRCWDWWVKRTIGVAEWAVLESRSRASSVQIGYCMMGFVG